MRQTTSALPNGGFDGASATQALAAGAVALESFGVPFIANPALPERLRRDALLSAPGPSTFYGEGPKGYTDYPTLAG